MRLRASAVLLLAVTLPASAAPQEEPERRQLRRLSDPSQRVRRLLGAALRVCRSRAAAKEVASLREELAGDVHRAALPDDLWIDLHLALDALDRRLDPEPEPPARQWTLPTWLDEVPDTAQGVAALTAEEHAVLGARCDAVAVPPGRAAPAERRALDRVRGRLRRFADVVRTGAESLPSGTRAPAAVTARAAEGLARDLAFRKRHDGPIGNARFDWMLRRDHRLRWDAPGLREAALELRRSALAALEAHAKRYGGGRAWRELAVEEKRAQPKDAAALLARCRADVAESVALLGAAGVVTLSDPEALEVDWMPGSVHHPFAMYVPVYSRRGFRGRYLVSRPPDGGAGEGVLPAYGSVHWMRVVSVHEAFPGHHLQHARAEGSRNVWRGPEFGYTSVHIEGWGFYCETLMDRLGFYEHPMTRLAYLRMRLWRAERALADIDVHTGRRRPGAAVDRLMREVVLSRREARSEVRTRLDRPTHGISYMTGARQIEALREAYLARHGKDAERAFHDRLLAAGPIPIDLLRAVLLDERAQYDDGHP